MTEPMPTEPHEGIKADAGPETEVAERDQSSYVARAGGSSGYVTSDPQPSDEPAAQMPTGGTAAGDALAGVTVDDDDLDDAVSGDTGPAHPGQRS